MTWLGWLGIVVVIVAIAAVTGIKPKGTRVVYLAYRARSGG